MPPRPKSQFHHVALIGKYQSAEVGESMRTLAHWLRDSGREVLIEHDSADALSGNDFETAVFDEIGRRAGAEIIVSHHKCSGRSNFGRMVETLAAEYTVDGAHLNALGQTVLAREFLVTLSHQCGRSAEGVATGVGSSEAESPGR